tara:strand:- start:17 stop:202 length:186 start_codon:yes stop_codon:yes gene_type:complete
MMSHDNLQAFIASNMNVMIHHNISISEIENMLPWERHILLGMIKDHVEQTIKRRQGQKHGR